MFLFVSCKYTPISKWFVPCSELSFFSLGTLTMTTRFTSFFHLHCHLKRSVFTIPSLGRSFQFFLWTISKVVFPHFSFSYKIPQFVLYFTRRLSSEDSLNAWKNKLLPGTWSVLVNFILSLGKFRFHDEVFSSFPENLHPCPYSQVRNNWMLSFSDAWLQ